MAQIIEKNPNVVVTVYSGRPLDLQGIDVAKGIVQAWQPEQKGQCASRNFVGTVQSKWSFKYVVSRNGWSSANFYNVDNTGRPYESAPEEKYVSKYLDVLITLNIPLDLA